MARFIASLAAVALLLGSTQARRTETNLAKLIAPHTFRNVAEQQSLALAKAESDLVHEYRATLGAVSRLYSELGMEEQVKATEGYRVADMGKQYATLSLIIDRLQGKELTAEQVNEAYTNYRFSMGSLATLGNMDVVGMLTGNLKDVRTQVDQAIKGVQGMKETAFGLAGNAGTFAGLLPESFQQINALIVGGQNLWKIAFADKGIVPLAASLIGYGAANSTAAAV